jgi:arginase
MNRTILTPFFLGRFVPGLLDLTSEASVVNDQEPEGSVQLERMSSVHGRLAEAVVAAVSAGLRPVSIAGDCCTSLAVMAGLERAGVRPHLIWFDAHGDFNTFETSPSGFLGGMPLAMMVGRGELQLIRDLGLNPLVESRATLTDGRDLDPLEREALEASRVHFVPRVEALVEDSLPEGPICVHYDTDIVTSAEVPAQNYPVPGGPAADDLGRVFDRLAATGRIVAASVSTWNPELQGAAVSRRISMELLRRLVG